MDRIFQATLQFIHPENTGQWTRTLSAFFAHFTRAYVLRFNAEVKEREKIAKKKQKSEDSKEESKEDPNGIKTDEPEEAKDNAENDNLEENIDQESPPEADDEEADSIQGEQNEEGVNYHLDDYCHDKLVGLMTQVVKNCIYNSDRSVTDNAASILRV